LWKHLIHVDSFWRCALRQQVPLSAKDGAVAAHPLLPLGHGGGG
jgi:hypothetical protein